MRTSKCAVLVGGCLALLFYGLLTLYMQNTDWLVLMLITPLVFILFIGVLLFNSKKPDIVVTRSLSNVKIFEDDPVEISLTLKNNGQSIGFIEIYDTLPNKVKVVKGSNFGVLGLKKNEEITIKYEILCPIRGRFYIGPLNVRVKDFLGLFYKDVVIDEPIESLTVIPRSEEIKDISVRAKSNPYPGLMQAKHAGIGTEFFGIRKYTTGDTFKKINWKSFAKFNEVMVNEFELESTTDVIIILDARENQSYGSLKHNPLEYSIKAALSIASSFLKQRDRVGFIGYGKSEGKLKWVYPESGKKQLYKLVEEIIEMQGDGDFPLICVINEAIKYMLPKGSLIIFISSMDDDPSIPTAIERLVARNYKVIAVSPSSIDLEYSLVKTDKNYDLAHRILSFKRRNFLAILRDRGARVVDWNPTLPLVTSLKEVERYQIRR